MPNLGLIAFLALISAPATNSGLIVFLPLVGAILGGIVGAVGGAWANSWYRDREAKKAEDQERRGLISLISAEVGFNDSFLSKMKVLRTASQLDTSAWDQAQARLSGLLPLEEITLIATYYAWIKRLRRASEIHRIQAMQSRLPGGDQATVKPETVSTTIQWGKAVSDLAQKYIVDPNVLKSISQQQDDDTEEAIPT